MVFLSAAFFSKWSSYLLLIKYEFFKKTIIQTSSRFFFVPGAAGGQSPGRAKTLGQQGTRRVYRQILAKFAHTLLGQKRKAYGLRQEPAAKENLR